MKISLLFVEHHLRSFWFRTGGEERILAALFSPPLPGKLLPIKTSKPRAAAAAPASSMALHRTEGRGNSVSETAEQQLLLCTLSNRPSLNSSFLKQSCRQHFRISPFLITGPKGSLHSLRLWQKMPKCDSFVCATAIMRMEIGVKGLPRDFPALQGTERTEGTQP